MADFSFAHEGVTLAYELVGDGEPIVLLHGFPFHRGMWRAQIEALADEFRVIAPDLRGFGQSALAREDVEDGVGMDRLAADVAAVLNHASVREPVVLVGFSMGGYAAFQFAFRWPQRLRGLVLADTRAVADTEEGRAGRLKMAEAALAAGDASPAEAMIPKLLAPASLESRPEIVAQVKEFITAASAQAIASAQRGMARREDVRERLGEIHCPVLGLVGAEDAIASPAEMRGIIEALPNGKLVEIPSAGHSTPLENPNAVTHALAEFSRSLAVGG